MQLRPSHGPSSTLWESLERWAGVSVFSLDRATHADRGQYFPAINMALAFCMGPDLQSLIDSNQPMAQIFFNSFGQKPTLAIWAIVVIVQ